MGRTFCDIKGDSYYRGTELGSRLERRMDSEGLKHRQYHKGYLVRLMRESGSQPIDGKWKGEDAIRVMKEEFKRVKDNNKSEKPVQIAIDETPSITTKPQKRTITFADATQLYMDAHDFASALSRFATTLLKVLEG